MDGVNCTPVRPTPDYMAGMVVAICLLYDCTSGLTVQILVLYNVRFGFSQAKLKEYSVILTTSFYGTNQKILTKKSLFPKFQLIQILRFQVMQPYDYVCFIAPIDYCVI